MQKGQEKEKRDAFALFPDLMQDLFGSSKNKKRKRQPESKEIHVVRPLPPDLGWLRQGVSEEQEKVEDIPAVLLLLNAGHNRDALSASWQELGYRVESSDSPGDAIEKLKAITFSAVLMHTEFEEEPLAESVVHGYLTGLPTSKRRTLFYILAGPDLRTLYDLEALSLSANLVINDENINQLQAILRKSFREYEELFGPLIEAMSAYEKQ